MDVMLDLETLGTRAGCVVLSIGAVPFDAEKGDVHNTCFYADLDIESQLEQGLSVDGGTVLWWLQQAEKPRIQQAKAARVHPGIVLDQFRDWYKALKGATIWGHGASFDPPILEAVYKTYGVPAPWQYRDVRDTRTLFAMASMKMGDFGTVNSAPHDALGDALWQAREVVKCVQLLRKVVLNGKQRIAELAQNDAELERQRATRNGDAGAGQVSQAEAGQGRNAYDAANEASHSAGDGPHPSNEGQAGDSFIRQVEAEYPPAAESSGG